MNALDQFKVKILAETVLFMVHCPNDSAMALDANTAANVKIATTIIPRLLYQLRIQLTATIIAAAINTSMEKAMCMVKVMTQTKLM